MPEKYQFQNRYIAIGGCRGGGRLHYLTKRYGYERIILEGIRLKVRFPLWNGADSAIERYVKYLQYEECARRFFNCGE